MADNKFDRENRSPDQIERELEQTRSQISQTIEAIQHRISPGQLANDAYGYLRNSGGGDFAKNLGSAAKNNPVPVALVGLGVAWLMFGGGGTPAYLQRSGTREYGSSEVDSGTSFSDGEPGSGRQSSEGYVRGAGNYAASVGHAISDAVNRVGSNLLGLGNQAGATAGGIRDSVAASASGASDRVRRMSEDARNLASEWTEQAGEMSEAARDRIHRTSEAVQEHAMQMRDNTSQMLRDQPLIAGALGIAIGAVLGALLPLSRRENQLMGETRDQVVDQAMKYGQQTFDQASEAAKNVANVAAEAVKDEAEKQGLIGGESSSDSQRTESGEGPQSGSSSTDSSEKWSGGIPSRSGTGPASSGQYSGGTSGQYSGGPKTS
jgi:ElaB/YqjD/DUF883 family membrane-anchored ribosome-binding protein